MRYVNTALRGSGEAEVCNQQVQRKSSVEDKSDSKEWLTLHRIHSDKETKYHVCEEEEEKEEEVEANIFWPHP